MNQYRVIHQAGFGTAINYNGNAANTSGNLIPPFGAFWIKNDWDPSNQPLLPNITLNRGMLTGSEDVIMHRNEVPQHLPLTVWAEDSTADQVIFRFNPEAGTAFNPALDASKWHSGIDGVPSLFFVADEGMECTIKAREEGAQTVPLSLKVNTANTRTYTFSADLSYWERQPNPLLYDKALKKTHDLSVGPYTFTMQPGEAEDRFELRFEASSASSQSPSMPPLQAWASGGLLTLKSNGAQTVTATLLSVSGQVIGTFKPTDAGMQVQLPARGLYLVQWSTGADAGVLKVLY